MHNEAFHFIKTQQPELAKSVIEIGSRDVNGSIRGLFNGALYVGLDIAPGPGVDVVADGREWLPRRCVDTVVCAEVLEHCEEPEAIVRNASQMLVKGGRLILTCATTGRPPHSGVDGGPVRLGEHYQNVPLDTIREALCDGFSEWDAWKSDERGDLYVVATK